MIKRSMYHFCQFLDQWDITGTLPETNSSPENGWLEYIGRRSFPFCDGPVLWPFLFTPNHPTPLKFSMVHLKINPWKRRVTSLETIIFRFHAKLWGVYYCWWFRNPAPVSRFLDSLSHYLHAFIHPRWLAGFLNHQRYIPIIQMFKPWNFKVSGSTMKGEGLLEIVSSVTRWSWLKNWHRNGKSNSCEEKALATQWKCIYIYMCVASMIQIYILSYHISSMYLLSEWVLYQFCFIIRVFGYLSAYSDTVLSKLFACWVHRFGIPFLLSRLSTFHSYVFIYMCNIHEQGLHISMNDAFVRTNPQYSVNVSC